LVEEYVKGECIYCRAIVDIACHPGSVNENIKIPIVCPDCRGAIDEPSYYSKKNLSKKGRAKSKEIEEELV
jgi:hypothetical protein